MQEQILADLAFPPHQQPIVRAFLQNSQASERIDPHHGKVRPLSPFAQLDLVLHPGGQGLTS